MYNYIYLRQKIQSSHLSWEDLLLHLESKKANELIAAIMGINEISYPAEIEVEVWV